jgi:hypothetical protein
LSALLFPKNLPLLIHIKNTRAAIGRWVYILVAVVIFGLALVFVVFVLAYQTL